MKEVNDFLEDSLRPDTASKRKKKKCHGTELIKTGSSDVVGLSQPWAQWAGGGAAVIMSSIPNVPDSTG